MFQENGRELCIKDLLVNLKSKKFRQAPSSTTTTHIHLDSEISVLGIHGEEKRGPSTFVSSKSAMCLCLHESVLGTKAVFPLAGVPSLLAPLDMQSCRHSAEYLATRLARKTQCLHGEVSVEAFHISHLTEKKEVFFSLPFGDLARLFGVF